MLWNSPVQSKEHQLHLEIFPVPLLRREAEMLFQLAAEQSIENATAKLLMGKSIALHLISWPN